MAMKNDNAFLLDKKLNLYEHQSSPNPNMPLRDLFYVAKQYEKLIAKKSLYSRQRMKIPSPHFVVFYNGEEEQPEKEILKLSDRYETPEEEPMLELKVQLLNINSGCNEELKVNCRTLKEYMIFVDKIRNKVKREKKDIAVAVDEAVRECISEDILRDFLISQRKEVVSMSIFEYDEERERKLLRESEFEAGMEAGMINGEMKSILSILSDLGNVGKELTEQIRLYVNSPVFKDLLKLAARSNSLEEFENKFLNLVK